MLNVTTITRLPERRYEISQAQPLPRAPKFVQTNNEPNKFRNLRTYKLSRSLFAVK